jgi:hypothetical protein
MTELNDELLRRARDLGAASYVSAYIHLMMRELGVDDTDNQAVNALASEMIEPINLATEAAFRALMADTVGMDHALDRLRRHLDEITPKIKPM